MKLDIVFLNLFSKRAREYLYSKNIISEADLFENLSPEKIDDFVSEIDDYFLRNEILMTTKILAVKEFKIHPGFEYNEVNSQTLGLDNSTIQFLYSEGVREEDYYEYYFKRHLEESMFWENEGLEHFIYKMDILHTYFTSQSLKGKYCEKKIDPEERRSEIASEIEYLEEQKAEIEDKIEKLKEEFKELININQINK